MTPRPQTPDLPINLIAREMSWQAADYDPSTGNYPPEKPEPTFNRACRMVLEDALKTQAQRGNEYGDSWAIENMNPIFLRALMKELGYGLSPSELRLVMLAALVDVKDSRIANGNLKEDSVIDGLNYRATLIQLLKEYRDSSSQNHQG